MPNSNLKCARCNYLKTFGCEHLTPVRNDLATQYLEEGRFYLQAKQQQQQQQQPSPKLSSTFKQNSNQRCVCVGFFFVLAFNTLI
jgi:hypothetical protein